MKHTLKSLLITTVLTLPTVFGSDEFAPSEDPATKAHTCEGTANQSLVRLSERATHLIAINRPKAAARLYLNSLDQDSSWDQVILIARKLEELGYPDLAENAYQSSMKHPKTVTFKESAEIEIKRLKQISSQRSQLTLDQLPTLLMIEMAGHTDLNKEIFLGWLNVQDLSRLSKIADKWYHILSLY